MRSLFSCPLLLWIACRCSPSLGYASFSTDDTVNATSTGTSNSNSNGGGGGNRTYDDDTAPLPDGVTMCDGSDPVGLDAAYRLERPVPYCMNHGRCRSDYRDNPRQPCLCGSAYSGPHCEFEAAAAANTTDATEPPECRLHCFLGECVVGAKSFELVLYAGGDGDSDRGELQYCDCGDRATGEYCEREARPCGTGHCLNGGTCLRVELEDGSEESFCDCTTSYTGPEAFAGQHCEHKVTTFCSGDVDANGRHFCVNDGVCRDDSYMGCTCPFGFSGPLCEFKDGEVASEYTECTLECLNNGVCRKGAKDVSYLEKFGLDRRLVDERFTNNFEHCVCPRGYVGLKCEYEMEVCPGRSVACMHGGQCKLDWSAETTEVSCDCATAETTSYRYAGQFCEVRSTSFCTADGEKTSDGRGYDAFCTNGGKCARLVEDGEAHPGCECSPGYVGSHCEHTTASTASDRSVVIASVLGGIGLLLLLVLTTILLYRRHKRRRIQRMRRAFSASKGYTDSAPAPTLASIHQHQPWMMTTADAVPEVSLQDVPLDDDEEDMDVSDHHSTACSFSPSDDTPTVNNVNYHHGVVLQSLQYKSSRSSRRFSSTSDYDDEFDPNSASALGRSHPFVTIT